MRGSASSWALVLFVVLAGCGGGGGESPATSEVRRFGEQSRDHVTTPVSYPQTPPVGGDHSPIPQTCGSYDQPVPDEQAVHSMEHGAVWITHRPDLPGLQVDRLRGFALQSHVLVSPYPGLPAPVVVSAWGYQVRLESADDPGLESFVTRFRRGPQTPEPGASCTGQGTPLVLGR